MIITRARWSLAGSLGGVSSMWDRFLSICGSREFDTNMKSNLE